MLYFPKSFSQTKKLIRKEEKLIGKETASYLLDAIEAMLEAGNMELKDTMWQTDFEGKDLLRKKGLDETLAFETLNPLGKIRSGWMEYLSAAFKKINGEHSKKIVLYLCQHNDREVTRKEIQDELSLTKMKDVDLEKKLAALVKADIIEQGQTNFDYRGVQDNIFDKVFRGIYQKEIQEFDVLQITKEYQALTEKGLKEFQKELGKLRLEKGLYVEYAILDQFRYPVCKKDKYFRSFTQNLPRDFRFSEYSRAWSYLLNVEGGHDYQVDIFAQAEEGKGYSVIGEVKNRESKKFSLAEAKRFLKKIEALKKKEPTLESEKTIGFVFSRNGFYQNAETFLIQHKIAYSDDERWLG